MDQGFVFAFAASFAGAVFSAVFSAVHKLLDGLGQAHQAGGKNRPGRQRAARAVQSKLSAVLVQLNRPARFGQAQRFQRDLLGRC